MPKDALERRLEQPGIELPVHRKVALPVNSVSWLIPDLGLMSAFLCVVLFSEQVIIAGSIAVAAKNLHLPTVSVHASMHIQHNSLKRATTEYRKIFTISVNATVEVPCHRNRTVLSLTSFKNHWARLNAAGCYTCQVTLSLTFYCQDWQ